MYKKVVAPAISKNSSKLMEKCAALSSNVKKKICDVHKHVVVLTFD